MLPDIIKKYKQEILNCFKYKKCSDGCKYYSNDKGCMYAPAYFLNNFYIYDNYIICGGIMYTKKQIIIELIKEITNENS